MNKGSIVERLCSDLDRKEPRYKSSTLLSTLYGMATMSYDDRLKLLGLDRLELRRLHADLTTCYKMINSIVAVGGKPTFRLPFTFAANSLVIQLKLTLTQSRVNSRVHAFPVRVITAWNRLLADVVRESSLLSFKNRLKSLI